MLCQYGDGLSRGWTLPPGTRCATVPPGPAHVRARARLNPTAPVMKLKLHEEPKEWLKFTVVMAVLPAAFSFALYRKGHLPAAGLAGVWGGLACVLLLCGLRPRLFRGFYRSGMTVTFHVGQVMGRVLLTIFFLVALTPAGLL